MTTYDDDYLQLEAARPDLPYMRRMAVRDLGLHWPPPEQIFYDGEVWERQTFSQLTDEQRAGTTLVCRGALYHPKVVDPDRPCEHADFHVHASVNRLTEVEGGPVTGYMAELTVRCADCGEKFRWVGCPAGSSMQQPMVSIDETEMRAPIRPSSSDPDFGMGLPGFSMRIRMPGEEVERPDIPGVDMSDPDDHGFLGR